MDAKSVLKHLVIGTMVPAQLKDNGAFAGNTYFDCAGLAAVLAVLDIGTVDAAIGSTDTSTAPYLEECDTTDGTYAAVTSGTLAAVIASTGDSVRRAVFVDRTKTRKRYLRWNAPTAGDGTTGCNMCAYAIGFPEGEIPATAAAMGLAELIQV